MDMDDTTGLPLFDLPAARAARDEAVERVESAADGRFNDQAFHALDRVARRIRLFIVDDVWKELGADQAIASTHDKRAMGAVMQRGRREGLIMATADFKASAQKQCHANPRRIWSSLVY